MNKPSIRSIIPALLFLIVSFLSCSNPKEESQTTAPAPASDAAALLQSFISGLWSLDSGNILTNEGFLILPDGSFTFVASEITGTWETPSADTLVVKYSDYYEDKQIRYTIDSISESKMILSMDNKKYIFRKVPFGIDPNETILNGYSGTLSAGTGRSYEINLPAGKKIGLKLTTTNPSIKLSFFEGDHEIAKDVQNWAGILIRGGKYRITLNMPKGNEQYADFDLKVISF